MGPNNRRLRWTFVLISLLVLVASASARAAENQPAAPRQMERLNRGLVAVKIDEGVYLSWRFLGTDPDDIAFNVYRDGEQINASPIATSTNYIDPRGTVRSTYSVQPIVAGEPLLPSAPVEVWETQYWTIPLQTPPDGVTPSGESYFYYANDASVGDLDGDGEYEIVLKWEPSNAKDNSLDGYTGIEIIDAYKLDGTHMWRITQGVNVRAGAHYTQFMVYDLDGDGKAEVAFRTADGTIDGQGNVIGDPNADYRDHRGRILRGPEYLTIFDGETGKALVTVDFEPARGSVSQWGDSYGNRSDRFLAAIAYLDGERPSLVMARGYYQKTMLVAYNYRDGELTKVWTFDSHSSLANRAFSGQGNHQLSVGDVDGDGKDEIIYGAMVVDHDGTGLYTTGWGHGDAMHAGDLDPTRPGLEVFQVHENTHSPYGASYRDARTGELIWGVRTGQDTGRGTAGDIDPRYPGAEAWASAGVGVYSAQGEQIATRPPSINFVVWWDGDLLRELLDDNYIDKWDWETGRPVRLLTAHGAASTNYTKATPALSADILGDWREEVIWRTPDNSALRVYTTTHPTEHRIPTLMHDAVYRLAIAWQNVAYNQPPHTGFFLGHDMPPPPKPNIRVTPGEVEGVVLTSPTPEEAELGVSGAVEIAVEQIRPEAKVQGIQVIFDGLDIAAATGLPVRFALDTLAVPDGKRRLETVVSFEDRAPLTLTRWINVENVRLGLSVNDRFGSGDVLRGELAVDFDVWLADGLELASATLSLDGDVVYEGTNRSGRIVVDGLGLPDGRHTLVLEAVTADGRRKARSVDFELENLTVRIATDQVVLRNDVAFDVSVYAADGLPIEEVLIEMSGNELYRDGAVPETIVVNTRAFPDGLHRLALIVKAGGREERHELQVSLSNRWQRIDNFLPPGEGWFSAIDRRETADESDGWTYATDRPDVFFGDEERLVRQADTTEWLVWTANDLETAKVTVYTPLGVEAADAFRLAVSADGESWTELPFAIEMSAASETGWRRMELTATNDGPSSLFRLTLNERGGEPDEIQLGRVWLVGFQEWTE